MTNSEYIKMTYKRSTIARLKDFGYDTEESINIDPDITKALIECKKLDLEDQDTLFSVIGRIHSDFYDMMDGKVY